MSLLEKVGSGGPNLSFVTHTEIVSVGIQNQSLNKSVLYDHRFQPWLHSPEHTMQ